VPSSDSSAKNKDIQLKLDELSSQKDDLESKLKTALSKVDGLEK